MTMHPRVCLHQVPFVMERASTTDFVDHCRNIGVPFVTLATTALLQPGGVEEAQRALAAGGPRVACVNHPFASYPNVAEDTGGATEALLRVIDITETLEARTIYLVSGGRGGLLWEAAADRFAAMMAPCIPVAEAKGIKLLVETASDFNVDIHMAHTLDDTILLAEIAGIGVCIELHACWFEAGLKEKFIRAMPNTGLVQVSDYVLGDRTAPCRAVIGDGVIPLEHLLRDLLDAGYEGVFDLELLGPRIQQEGTAAATRRAAENLSTLLTKLGA